MQYPHFNQSAFQPPQSLIPNQYTLGTPGIIISVPIRPGNPPVPTIKSHSFPPKETIKKKERSSTKKSTNSKVASCGPCRQAHVKCGVRRPCLHCILSQKTHLCSPSDEENDEKLKHTFSHENPFQDIIKKKRNIICSIESEPSEKYFLSENFLERLEALQGKWNFQNPPICSRWKLISRQEDLVLSEWEEELSSILEFPHEKLGRSFYFSQLFLPKCRDLSQSTIKRVENEKKLHNIKLIWKTGKSTLNVVVCCFYVLKPFSENDDSNSTDVLILLSYSDLPSPFLADFSIEFISELEPLQNAPFPSSVLPLEQEQEQVNHSGSETCSDDDSNESKNKKNSSRVK